MEVRYKKRKINDAERISILSKNTGLSPFMVDMLAARGFETEEAIKRFLNPGREDFIDPFVMPDMRAVKDRIERAVENKEKIVIYGDYDCDGVCAAAILYGYFKGKTEVCYHIPERKNGYGLSAAAIDKIAESVFPDLLITVDCGVTSVDEVEYCKDLGIDVIITDHHMPQNVLPAALILNPKICGYGNELCGAGVAFKLVEALAGYEIACEYLDIAAIATIGDIVPLRGENRALAALGIKDLNTNVRRKGLKQLFSSIKLEKITASDIAYMIVPRLNAAGRMGLANRALELLISDDYFDIQCLIKELNRDNGERQNLLNDVFCDVCEQLERDGLHGARCIVMNDIRWEGGILGIACSKAVVEFNRPVILFTEKDGILKGSARSIPGINIYEALFDCKELFLNFGGHSQAAGLSLKKENFEEFKERINACLKKYDDAVFAPEVVYDAELNDKPDIKDIRAVSALEPFGEGNPKPVYLLNAKKMKFSRINGTAHIRERDGAFETVGFGMLDRADFLNSDTQKRLVITADVWSYNNTEYIKGVIQTCYAANPEAATQKSRLLEAYATFGHTAPQPEETNVNREQRAVKNTALSSENEKTCEIGDFSAESHVKYFDKNQLIDIIESTDALYGTAFIAFDDGTAKDFFELFHKKADKLLVYCVGGFESKNPYNRLILSPKDEPLRYYDRIVFLDRPLFYPKGYFSGKVYAVTEENPLDKVFSEFVLDDADIKNAYVLLRAFIKNAGDASGLLDLYIKTVKNNEISYTGFAVSFSIFLELRLIKVNKPFKLSLTEEKTSLENSAVYRKLKGI
ncbi:MAG: single-stranded-DNA-specific exonuclease RecJ [Clostridiales bacterium]|jgi:single-stranded-DNA-specific exonuclease RecJ|nr:single-stranded-DNA-specific exonuclease RecJ [Clostridiales bacterium]